MGHFQIKRVEELTKTVLGGSSLNEAHFLYSLAKEGPGRGVIVEIGSFCGYSTIWLAQGSKSAKREMVYAIDPQNDHFYGNNELIFRKNIKEADVDDYIIPLIMTSEEAARHWDGKPIRLLFIDGNHEYEYVKKDILLWEPYLINGGVTVFHDCFCVSFPDVLKCVEEYIFNSDKFANLGVIDTILYASKRNSLTTLEKIKKERFIELLSPLQNVNHSAEKAQIYTREGKFNKAEREIKNAEKTIQVLGRAFSDFGKFFFNFLVGELYLNQGKYKEAEERYNEALSIEVPDSQRFHAITGLADLYTRQGKYKEAEERYKEALSLVKSLGLDSFNP